MDSWIKPGKDYSPRFLWIWMSGNAYSPTKLLDKYCLSPPPPPLIIASSVLKFLHHLVRLMSGEKLYPSTTSSCLYCQIGVGAQVGSGPAQLCCLVLCYCILFLLSCQVLLRYRLAFHFRKLLLNRIHPWFSRHLLNRFICFTVTYKRAHIRFMILSVLCIFYFYFLD